MVVISLFLCKLLVYTVMSTEEKSSVDRSIFVYTTSGRIQGSQHKTSQGNVKIFHGIPYAKPPVGARRFKPSEPLLDFHGQESKQEIKFENVVPACMQPLHLNKFSHPSIPQGGLHVSEDCLKLNLYMPNDVQRGEKFPVVVWIPGDGFEFADASQYDGSTMATLGRIIVVVANYRVGIFGFGSNGTPTAPGNLALHDIINTLKWTIANGQYFNASNDDITLAGRFSGSMAISALISSPMFFRDDDKTKPMAKKIILHGGVAGGHYTVESQPQKSFANFIGKMNCHNEDNEKIMKCLSQRSEKEIQEESHRLFQSWRPTIDNKTIMGDPLTRVEMGEFSKDLKVMIGDSSGSGSICYLSHFYRKTGFIEDLINDRINNSEFLVELQKNIKEFFDEEGDSLASAVAHEYLHGIMVDKSLREAYFRFCGTLYIRNPTELYARYLSRFNIPVYRYEFSYRLSFSPYPQWFNGGISDEIVLLFPPEGIKMTEQDDLVKNAFLSSWISFIKTGEVTVGDMKWENFDEESKRMTLIDENGFITQTTSKFLDREVNFWRSVFSSAVDILKREQKCDESKTEVKRNRAALQNYDLSTHYFTAFVVVVGLSLAAILSVCCIRNWSKPYLWKFS